MSIGQIKQLFAIAGLYDFVLGIAFLLAGPTIYQRFGITPPNHDGYVQFGAALIAIFGIGFWYVSKDPVRNRAIVIMGILLKIAYSFIVLFHHYTGSVPGVWVTFAWCDLAFLALFVAALRALPEKA